VRVRQVVPKEGMPISRSPTERGDLVVFASPVSAESYAQLRQYATILMYIVGIYIFINYSSLIMPLLMMYQLMRAAGG